MRKRKITIREYYCEHRRHSAERNIPFLLTFDEWWMIWEQSGHWNERGNRRGQYCMSRPGDQGAYEIGNVKIVLNEDNRSERNRNYPLIGERSPSYGKNYWAAMTPERRKQAGTQLSEKRRGKPKSEEHKLKIRQSNLVANAARRFVFRNGRRAWAWPGDADYPRGIQP